MALFEVSDLEVEGLGFRVWGLGLGFGVWGLGLRVFDVFGGARFGFAFLTRGLGLGVSLNPPSSQL